MTTTLRLSLALPVAAVLPLVAGAVQAQTVPAGFVDSQVAAVGNPTDLAFLPDGRLLITAQGGSLRVYCPNNTAPGCSTVSVNGGLLATPALTLSASQICSNSERGLLGVAVDPDFPTSNYIYVFYTFNTPGSNCAGGGGSILPPSPIPVNRVSRFTYNSANNTADLASQLVLVDKMVSTAGNHNAGAVGFGKDGYLYITIGDGGADYAGDSGSQGGNDAARDENRLAGKVLRITSTGGIPPANPFASTGDICAVNGGTTPGRRCRETFSWGHRNPFRIAFDPNTTGTTTRFFVNEVGEGTWEEINEEGAATAGSDFGWPCREGKHVQSSNGKCNPPPSNMVDPIFEYPHATIPGTTITGANCITGGAFVPNGVWPAAYNGLYLAADYGAGGIFKMTTAAPYVASNFGTGLGTVTSLRFGPYQATQALYYTTYVNGGQVRRIVQSLPKAVVSSDVQGGRTVPLAVTFSGAGSSDPNGLALTYVWDFGDGSGVQETPSLTIAHSYLTKGMFTATLRVRNTSNLTSDPVTLLISAGSVAYYTVSPCRLIDTRASTGVPIGGPVLTSGTANMRTFTLTGQCGVPAGVRALAANLTVVSPTLPGDLRLVALGGQVTASSINFGTGQIRANNAIVSVDGAGKLTVTCDMPAPGTTHFILDVVGYYQ